MIMKKLAVLLLALLLIATVCAGCSSRDSAGDSAPAATVKPDPPLEELLAAVRSAENAGEAIRVVTQTGSADDRLALLNEIADVFAEELETGGWDFRMDQISFGSGLWPIPDTENAVQAENPAELFSGRRIVALYNRKGSLRFLTEFFVRLPKSMRATSVADADSVLYLKEYLEERTDYTGKAYNRIYELFLIDLKDQTVYLIRRRSTTPPMIGKGTLEGAELSMGELWSPVESAVFSTFTLTYPEGTAEFLMKSSTCSMYRLDGEFTHYEIPAEVEGLPVRIITVSNKTLETLVLPEGVTVISGITCTKLKSMNFPSTVRRIGNYALSELHIGELNLNEGLETVGDHAIPASENTLVTLPSTLKEAGEYFLRDGVANSWLVFPESMSALPTYCLEKTGRLICVYLPAGMTTVTGSALNFGCNVIIYTPENSAAARWAADNNFRWVACSNPDDMPHPEYFTNESYEYALVESEIYIRKYLGNEAYVAVPESIDGHPVTTVMEDAFADNDDLRVLVLPESVTRLNSMMIRRCKNLGALFIPKNAETPSFTYYTNSIADTSEGQLTVYTPADALCRDAMEAASNITWAEWIPGMEETILPADISPES